MPAHSRSFCRRVGGLRDASPLLSGARRDGVNDSVGESPALQNRASGRWGKGRALRIPTFENLGTPPTGTVGSAMGGEPIDQPARHPRHPGLVSQRLRLGERPTEPVAQRLKFCLVDLIKRSGIIRVHIEHRKKAALRCYDRDDDFRLRRRRTCDMSRERVDIRHELRLARPRGRAANTAIEREAQAAVATLIGANDQQVIRNSAVKHGPVKVIVRGVELARNGRHRSEPGLLSLTKHLNAPSYLGVSAGTALVDGSSLIIFKHYRAAVESNRVEVGGPRSAATARATGRPDAIAPFSDGMWR